MVEGIFIIRKLLTTRDCWRHLRSVEKNSRGRGNLPQRQRPVNNQNS